MRSIQYVVRWTTVLLSLFLLVGIGVTAVAASSADSHQEGSKTRRSFLIVQPYGIFDPSYKYLDRGDTLVGDLGNERLKITVTTEAKSSVDSIGATVQLQRWTGSSWVNAGNSSTKHSTDTWYYQHTLQLSVESGYYYRVKTNHWVTHGGAHESEETVTTNILIQ